jgi:type VI protein secretion system component VasK
MMNEWTVQTLKEMTEQRFTDSDKAIQAALSAAKEAVVKAELAADKRFELLNELRSGVATHEQLEALEKVVDDLKDRINTSQGKGQGFSQSWGIFVAIVTIAVALLGVMILSANGKFK